MKNRIHQKSKKKHIGDTQMYIIYAIVLYKHCEPSRVFMFFENFFFDD